MRLVRFVRARGGNFATLTALIFPVMLLGAGLTLNSGALFLQKRSLQSVTDLAALTAAANMTKATEAAVLTFGDNGIEDLTVLDSATESLKGRTTNGLKVVLGRYTTDPSKPRAERFVGGAIPANAVKVSAVTKGHIYFPTPVLENSMIATSAIASIAPEASFSIGSRLGDVETHTSIFNGVLGGLLGTKLSLTASDYKALLDTNVDALAFMDALASELNLTAGTYRQVLDTSTSVGTILKAAAIVPGLDAKTKTAFARIISALPTRPRTVALSKLIELDKAATQTVGTPRVENSKVIPTTLGLLDLINATAALSNGANQVAVTSGLDLSPLANVQLELAIGEPPQGTAYLTMGRTGQVVYTAQTRLKLSARIGTVDIGTSFLPKLVAVNLPIYLDLASARAELTSLSCPGNIASAVSVGIDATPALAEMRIQDVTRTAMQTFTSKPATAPVTLIDLLVAKVTASAQAAITNTDPTPLTFRAGDISARTIKQASVRNYTETLLSTMLKTLSMKVDVLGILPLSGDSLKGLIAKLIADAAAPLDTMLFNILTALGVKLGSVDVWVNGASCSQPVLVQ